ncbi:site-2 protease family protein [Candidatus Saccharibacteria bacterium]|nr:site-2 protease family protein [Candidatus Saccharibacteria bacterium]
MDFGKLLIILAIVLVSTVLHELAHGFVAHLLGDETAKEEGRLSLNPVKHIDPVMSIFIPLMLFAMHGPIFGGAKPVPVDSRNLKGKEWGMALVAIAGPLTNFLLALAAFVIGRFTGLFNDYSIPGFIASECVLINLGLMLFNILPIPPLDGSRVLYAIAPDGVRKVMRSLETYGIFIVLILVWVCGDLLSRYLVFAMDGIIAFFTMLTGGA